jgi:hypothetical protein
MGRIKFYAYSEECSVCKRIGDAAQMWPVLNQFEIIAAALDVWSHHVEMDGAVCVGRLVRDDDESNCVTPVLPEPHAIILA